VPRPASATYDPGVGDYRTRAVTRDDASAVNSLLAAAEAVEHTGEHYTVDDVVEELGNPMIDLARDWVVVEHEGRVVAHGVLTPRAPFDGALKVEVGGTVHPDHRGRGIGSRLVPAMLDRAHAYVRERGADLSPVITAHAPSENTDLADILGRHGLEPHRWSFLMQCELSGLPAADAGLPDGYVVETWEGADQDELRRAHNAAFVDHPGFVPWSPELWTQWVSGTRNSRPALSLVARDAAGRVAAYVQLSEFDAVELATGIREAYVHKVGTLRAHRRRGLAGALLRSALRRCREEGYAVATLDVDSENPTGALGLYESVGFRTIQRWTDYWKPVPLPTDH
jgi:mycothiol synthase